MNKTLTLSPLGHTWLLDLDGSLVVHNGYLGGGDTWLEGAKEFLQSIPGGDMIIFITSRAPEFRAATEQFLKQNGIRYDHIIFGAPYGERILINDKKPSGLTTAIAVNTDRDDFCNLTLKIDGEL